MSVAMRTRIRSLAEGWARQGHDLALGIGIAQGYATLGKIGFDGRFDYAAIGTVTNLAARLCSEAAPWQILVTERVFSSAGPPWSATTSGPATCAASAAPSARTRSRASTVPGILMTGDVWSEPAVARQRSVVDVGGGEVPPLRPAPGKDA